MGKGTITDPLNYNRPGHFFLRLIAKGAFGILSPLHQCAKLVHMYPTAGVFACKMGTCCVRFNFLLAVNQERQSTRSSGCSILCGGGSSGCVPRLGKVGRSMRGSGIVWKTSCPKASRSAQILSRFWQCYHERKLARKMAEMDFSDG